MAEKQTARAAIVMSQHEVSFGNIARGFRSSPRTLLDQAIEVAIGLLKSRKFANSNIPRKRPFESESSLTFTYNSRGLLDLAPSPAASVFLVTGRSTSPTCLACASELPPTGS
ncbi:hypothetical protein WJX74_001763 [Apatococcus lobatus]|uniref:Uncharacterized protein n=1 Tax=Apatococcus lobatus TaxID=904363 RepID=A0AAW1RE80_9CHLO